MPSINASIQHCIKHPTQYIKIRKEIKHRRIQKENTKLSLLANEIITCIQNPKGFVDRFLEGIRI